MKVTSIGGKLQPRVKVLKPSLEMGRMPEPPLISGFFLRR